MIHHERRGETFAGQSELQDRDGGCAVRDDQGWRRALRQLLQLRLRGGGDLREGLVDAGGGLKNSLTTAML